MSVTKIFLLALFQGFHSGFLCQEWEFPSKMVALIGSCVEIPCTYYLPSKSGKSSVVWYLYDTYYYILIFNSKIASSVRKDYGGRTSLKLGSNSCTLRIDPVRRADKGQYYPGIAENTDINAWRYKSRTIHLDVTDSPRQPTLVGPGNMIEGNPTIITCAAEHTCASSPPSLEWNKPGQTKRQSVGLSGGSWREELHLIYIPSHVDHGTELQCTAAYHNGLRSQNVAPLNIKFPPKNVSVILRGNKDLMQGSNVTLSCTSISNPPVNRYQWYKGKNKMILPDRGPEITVRNLTRDTDPYSCTAVNEVASGASALTEIPVQYAAIGVHVIITSKTENGLTELTCDFLSSRPNVTHYTWLKDKAVLLNKTEQILVVYSTAENSGDYSCVAHNNAGESSSVEVFIEADDGGEENGLIVTLLALGGVILLFLLILIVYCYISRKNSKSAHPTSPIFGTSTTRIPLPHMTTQQETLVEEHQYGNIQNNKNTQPGSMISPDSSNHGVEQSHAIYSNDQAFLDVEYSAISHAHHDQSRKTYLDINHGEHVEYATVKS